MGCLLTNEKSPLSTLTQDELLDAAVSQRWASLETKKRLRVCHPEAFDGTESRARADYGF
jgi:hypothetical protein